MQPHELGEALEEEETISLGKTLWQPLCEFTYGMALTRPDLVGDEGRLGELLCGLLDKVGCPIRNSDWRRHSKAVTPGGRGLLVPATLASTSTLIDSRLLFRDALSRRSAPAAG